MYGAMIGDIVGSPFEFDRGNKTKEFELFSSRSCFTDDTVMTIAVGEALMNAGRHASVEEIKENVIKSMREWGRKYPHAGYGCGFSQWLRKENPKPYNSYGNGSAMRVSAAGWLYDSLERTREVARATAEVTHNHPEGIKGAEAKNNDFSLCGSVSSDNEKLEGYSLYLRANLCDEEGGILYINKSYSGISFEMVNYDAFSISCSDLTRFFDIDKLHHIEIYPNVRKASEED